MKNNGDQGGDPKDEENPQKYPINSRDEFSTILTDPTLGDKRKCLENTVKSHKKRMAE